MTCLQNLSYSNLPGKSLTTLFPSQGKEKRVRRIQGTHFLVPPYLQKQKVALCSRARARQAAVQLGSCLFSTTASSQNSKNCKVVCVSCSCSGRRIGSAWYRSHLGWTPSRCKLLSLQCLRWNHSLWKLRIWPHFSHDLWRNNADAVMKYLSLYGYLYFPLYF